MYALRSARPRQETVHVVRYALNTASVHRPVLPPLTDTLLVADKFRSAVLALHGARSRNLSGHEEDGDACRAHDHAYWWPTDEDNDGFLDHVTVYCPAGFESSEIAALRRLVRIRQRGGRPDLLVTPVYAGAEEAFRPWRAKDSAGNGRSASVFVSATPYFCPVHLSRGKGRGGRIRSVRAEIIKGLLLQGIVGNEADVEGVEELVFDYAPPEFARLRQGVDAGQEREPVPPRQYFPVIDAPDEFPRLPRLNGASDARYPNALLKDPDAVPGYPLGLSVGLFVDNGTRFIRALGFCRRRRNAEVKALGRMFRIRFAEPRPPRPFAIGAQCHFGLGLFVPVKDK